jgi:hypothetical protein
VIFRDEALCLGCHGNRDAGGLDPPEEGGPDLHRVQTDTHDGQWAPGLRDHPGCPDKIRASHAAGLEGERGLAGMPARKQVGGPVLLAGDIAGQAEIYRAGSALNGQVQGALHRGRGVDPGERVAPLGDGAEEFLQVHALMGEDGRQLGGELGGNDEERRALQEGVGHAVHQIGGAGPHGGQGHARLPGELARDARHDAGGVFVPGQQKCEAGAVTGHHDLGNLASGQAEDAADPIGLQRRGDDFGCRGHGRPPHGRDGPSS